MDARRGERRVFDPMPLMHEARDEGVRVGWRELVWLLERNPRGDPWTPSELLLDFLGAYLADRGADWMVDPCATTPTLLPALLDAGAAQRSVGFVRQLGVGELSSLTVDGDDRLGWQEGWQVPFLSDADDVPSLGTPDLIVSMPLAGLRGGEGQMSTEEGVSVDVRDEVAHLTVLNATQLAPGGEAIFLLPNGFLVRRDARRVREVLRRARAARARRRARRADWRAAADRRTRRATLSAGVQITGRASRPNARAGS
jgi:hypothetical protein